MSASLVGSEMCIRDRVNARRQPMPTRVQTPRGRPPIRVTSAPAGGQSEACLLYTSDAADDM
eukprot:4636220-Alexandrium_andersonii.AAC.1